MHNPIQALYQDPKLSQIRREIQSKQGNIPVLLLPVRIETRFMKVVKSEESDQRFDLEATLESMYKIGKDLKIDLSTATSRQRKDEAGKIVKALKDTRNQVKKLQELDSQEKSWLKLQLTYLKNLKTDFALGLNNKNQAIVKNKINQQIDNLEKTIEGLDAKKASYALNLSQLIKDMQKHLQLLKLTNSEKIPFRSPQKKAKLYNFIQTTLEDLLKLYERLDIQKNSILKVHPNQLNKIKEIQDEIEKELNKIPSQLAKVYLTPKPWIKFIDALATTYQKQGKIRRHNRKSWMDFLKDVEEQFVKQKKKKVRTSPSWKIFFNTMEQELRARRNNRDSKLASWQKFFLRTEALVNKQQKRKKIKAHASWQSFVDQMELKIKHQLKPACKKFERDVLSRLESVKELETSTSRELYFQGIQVLQELDAFNQKSETKAYHKLRASRRKIKKRIDTLAKMANGIVEGKEAQLEMLSSLWENLGKAFDQYSQKVSDFSPNGKSQQFGLKATLDFATNKGRQAYEGLKNYKPQASQFFSSLDINESINFFQEVMPALGDFVDRKDKMMRDNHLSHQNREALSQDLDAILVKFEIARRKKMVFSNRAYEALQAKLEELGQHTSLLDSLSSRGNKTFGSRLDRMMNTLQGHEKTITDRNNPLYESERLKPVVSVSTTLEDELWVRIYPDDIAIHTHEEGLTELELRLGKLYWVSFWAASLDKSLELGAWKSLCEQLGPRRAAWVAKILDPRLLGGATNIARFNSRPSASIQNVIAKLQEIVNLLAVVHELNSIQEVIEEINETGIISRLNSSRNLLRAIASENQYLLQQAAKHLRKIQAALNKMQSLTQALNPGEEIPILTQLQRHAQIYERFNTCVDLIAQIQAVPMAQFLTQFEDPFDFPEVSLKEEDWTQVPKAHVLPECFALICMQGDKFTHIKFGEKIDPDALQMGLDPDNFENEELFAQNSAHELQLEEGLRWMTDFDKAVEVGMGFRLPLSPKQAADGFDKVMVLGIKEGTQLEGKAQLEKLLENHHYIPEGMGILPIGTPTNNTEGSPAYFQSNENDYDHFYRVERDAPLFDSGEDDPIKQADGKRLANALGIDPAVFQHIENSGEMEISESMQFNRVLWPATLGYYMEEILDNFFTYDNIRHSQDFFNQFCVASGFLPSIRVGTQPYGILPTTAFSRFRAYGESLPSVTVDQIRRDVLPLAIRQKLQNRFDIRLPQLLWGLNQAWKDIREEKVKHLYNVGTDDPQKHFLEMLGLRAHSVDYHFRYGANIANRNANDVGDFSIDFEPHLPHAPSKFWQLVWPFLEKGVYARTFNFGDELFPFADPVINTQRRIERTRDEQVAKARIYKTRFFDKHSELLGVLVGEESLPLTEALPNLAGQDKNYIGHLADLSPLELFANNQVDAFPSNSLLFLLLRQVMMLTFNKASLDILERENLFSTRYRKQIVKRGHYGVNFSEFGVQYSTRWSYMFDQMDFIHSQHGEPDRSPYYAYMGEETVANYIFPTTGNALFNGYSRKNRHRSYINDIKKMHDQLRQIQHFPIKQLDRLLRMHIDLCTYRLDAWTLGVANKRLTEHRFLDPDNQRTARQGIYLGAYGWVENLRPGGVREEAKEVPEGLYKVGGSPIYIDEDNDGALHMPSINHANTAAILRAGYKANQDAFEDLNNKMAINISSSRVRRALSLLNGVRNGLEVGAVLGFQLERGMHDRFQEAELNQFIYPLRKAFPLRVTVDSSMTANDAQYTGNVIDAMSLLDKVNDTVQNLDFERGKNLYELLSENNFSLCPQWLKDIILTNGGTNQQLNVFLKEVDRIADTFDALGDLALSESVYQIVNGNHVRAGAVLKALAEGRALPLPQIIDTPRTGVVITQRLALHFEPVLSSQISPNLSLNETQLRNNRRNALASGWKNIPFSPKALVSPSLNKWLGSVIGDPSSIRCIVSYELEDVLYEDEINWADLEMQAIDLLYLLGNNQDSGGSELNSRIAYLCRNSQEEKLGLDIELNIQYQRRMSNWDSTIKTFYEVQAFLVHLFELLNGGEYADAQSLTLPADKRPADDNLGQIDEEDLRRRIEDSVLAFRQIHAGAEMLLEAISPETISEAQVSSIRNVLLASSAYNIANAVPDAVAEVDAIVGQALYQQLQTTFKSIDRCIKAIVQLEDDLAQTTKVEQRIPLYLDIGHKMFGSQFLILPQYQPADLSEIQLQMNLPPEEGLLRASQPLIMDDWLRSLSKVRPKMYALEMASILCETMGQDFPAMKPLQFPFVPQADASKNDHWLGGAYPEEYEPNEDKLSLILMNPTQGVANRNVGIVLDEWIEILPQKTETSGIAFNYDQPAAMAPQSLLLAVNPGTDTAWEWDDLVYTLIDTQELMKNRAVEPEHLDDSPFAQVLPGVLAEVVPSQFKGSEDDFRRVILDFYDNKILEE